MSKKKKDKVKAGKKSSAPNGGKKALKKAEKLSKKMNAAKKPSKPEKKLKTVVKKLADKSKKVAAPLKKAQVKAPASKIKPKTSKSSAKLTVKKEVKNNKVKSLAQNRSGKTLKKVTVAKKAPVKVIATKANTKTQKASKPVEKVAAKTPKINPKMGTKPAPAADKKTAAKPVASMGSITKKQIPIATHVAAKKAEPASLKKSEEPTKKMAAEKKSNDVLAITNTIPVRQNSELSASKIASISSSITNPIKKTDSYSVKPEKEPTGKFELEFVVHSSAEMLYEFLSTPSGLSEWFCDDLNIRNGIYTFIWDDQLQQARLLKTVDQQVVRFQWVDKTDGSYFEFRIQRDDLTNDISLIITDFAETVAERESSKLLWHSQIEKLMHVIGSIF